MFTLIRIKILTDNKGIGNFCGDTVESNIQNQTSCKPVFQLVFLGEHIFTELLTCNIQRKHCLAHTAEGCYKAQILRTIHRFIFSV